MHVDWQQITALAIVSLAALSVGRRMWGQVAAFRNRPGKSGGACDGCPSGGSQSGSPKTASSPLMQIQTKPPVHLRRPPSE